METTQNNVEHVKIALNASFAKFKENLEKKARTLPQNWQQHLAENPSKSLSRLEELAGDMELVIFTVLDHGQLFAIDSKPRNALLYLIGNPLVAYSMTRHEIGVALYVPLRVLLYEDADGKAFIEFDRPSSLLNSFGEKVKPIADALDRKLQNLIVSCELP